MSKKTTIWLVIATSLVIIGSAIFISAIASVKWDFNKLNTVDYETNTYEIGEAFNDISITTDIADIILVPSEDENCKVICFEQEQLKHAVGVNDNKLEIKEVDDRKWYEHIGIFVISSPKITVYLPKTEYTSLVVKSSTSDITIPENFAFEQIEVLNSTGDVTCFASASEHIKMKLSTGSISIKDISAGVLDLTVSTGRINLQNITCKKLISEGDTGDITMKNVIAEELFSIERSTGDVRMEACDAVDIDIETDTGDVSGSLLTDKMFLVETDTGRVDVPRTDAENQCSISTDTGDIKITIKK